MNKIEFRVWSKASENFECSVEDWSEEAVEIYVPPQELLKYSIQKIEEDDNFAIQQFVGALDKNQVKIFSGDIVLLDQQDPFDCTPSKAKKVVGWNQRRMQFRLYNHPTEIGQSGGEEFLAEDVVVIGHIFDWKNEECRYLLDESVKNNP